MRVVDITTFFSETCGGIKTYYRHKARFLPALGIECHFVVPGREASETPFGDAVLHRVPGPPLPGNGAYRLFGRRSAVVDLLRRLEPDVVEVGSHVFLPAWVAEAVARAGRRTAVVGFFHSDVPRTLIEPALQWLPGCLRRRAVAAAWRFFRRRHERYRATLVASRQVASLLSGVGIPQVRWVGLGVDAGLFRPAPAGRSGRLRPVVGYAGRLSSDKAFGLLLDAWPTIHDATGALLHVIGDGPQRKRLLDLASRRGDVSYRGCLQRPGDVAGFLADVDLVVTPGARETFSLSTAEALACATPVVAPDQGAAAELVSDSGAGTLFAAGEAMSLAAAAVGILRMPSTTRAELGTRGRAYIASRYDWPDVAQRLAQVYEEVAA